ncbi:hypothetical protein XENOCAPTIV_017974 [Xenoophorus captivus]|uniref:Uncharacterized protein n=1 Tax=Xenoophorus captivus TaxID=1517983 RepID=A0ABV0R9M1_9TELE
MGINVELFLKTKIQILPLSQCPLKILQVNEFECRVEKKHIFLRSDHNVLKRILNPRLKDVHSSCFFKLNIDVGSERLTEHIHILGHITGRRSGLSAEIKE